MTYNPDVVLRRSISKQIKFSEEEIDYILLCKRQLLTTKKILDAFNCKFNRTIKNVYSITRILKKFMPVSEYKSINALVASISAKSKPPMSAQQRKKRSLANIGKKHTAETLEKMRLSRLGIFHRQTYITINGNKININKFSNDHLKFIWNAFNLHKQNTAKTARLFNIEFGANITKGQIERTIHGNILPK